MKVDKASVCVGVCVCRKKNPGETQSFSETRPSHPHTPTKRLPANYHSSHPAGTLAVVYTYSNAIRESECVSVCVASHVRGHKDLLFKRTVLGRDQKCEFIISALLSYL